MIQRVLLLLSILSIQVVARATEPLPKDVAKYIDQREACYHISGEIPDPSEQERLQEVIREINRQCKGLEQKQRRLKKKYAANAAVTARLARIEADIESGIDPFAGPDDR